MGQPIGCDLGCDLAAALLVTNLADGSTLAVCPDHIHGWATDLAQQFRRTPLPTRGGEDDEESDEDEVVAPSRRPSRPRRPRLMAVDETDRRPAVEPEAQASAEAG